MKKKKSLKSPKDTSMWTLVDYENYKNKDKFEMKVMIPLFFVIQLHLLNSRGWVVGGELGGWCWWRGLEAIVGSLLSRGEIKRSASEIFSSSGVKESAWEESFEFCDRDKDMEDKDKDEVLFWSPMGYTFLRFLVKKLWFNIFCVSFTLLHFSTACLRTLVLDIVVGKSKI